VAVPASECFDYEVTLTRGPDGCFEGIAVSRQTVDGGLPGMAGSRPRVRVAGETVRVESASPDEPLPRWTEWLVLWLPPLHDRWVARRLRGAQVRAFELAVPGIAEHLQDDIALRLRHNALVGPGTTSKLGTEVTLTDRQGVVAVWTPEQPVRSSW
jgi:hypothetical protein